MHEQLRRALALGQNGLCRSERLYREFTLSLPTTYTIVFTVTRDAYKWDTRYDRTTFNFLSSLTLQKDRVS
jgi:hypothetical protein